MPSYPGRVDEKRRPGWQKQDQATEELGGERRRGLAEGDGFREREGGGGLFHKGLDFS